MRRWIAWSAVVVLAATATESRVRRQARPPIGRLKRSWSNA
jgi:hypothetical protein